MRGHICNSHFVSFDVNKNGQLEDDQVTALCGKVCSVMRIAQPSPGEVQLAMAEFDTTLSGGLDTNEFACFFESFLELSLQHIEERVARGTFQIGVHLCMSGEKLFSVNVTPISTGAMLHDEVVLAAQKHLPKDSYIDKVIWGTTLLSSIKNNKPVDDLGLTDEDCLTVTIKNSFEIDVRVWLPLGEKLFSVNVAPFQKCHELRTAVKAAAKSGGHLVGSQYVDKVLWGAIVISGNDTVQDLGLTDNDYLSVRIGGRLPPTELTEDEYSWSLLVGQPAEEAVAKLLALSSPLSVEMVSIDASVIMDFNRNRVWLWVDSAGYVAYQPKRG